MHFREHPVFKIIIIYAVAAILGSVCYLICVSINIEEIAAVIVIVSVVFVVGIRMPATKKRLNLPKVKRI